MASGRKMSNMLMMGFMGEKAREEEESNTPNMDPAIVSSVLNSKVGNSKPEDKSSNVNMMPSLKNFMQHSSKRAMFPEEMSTNLDDAKTPNYIADMNNLASKSPLGRAIAGAKVGAKLGMRSKGIEGGMMGIAMGSMLGRSLGMKQAGEIDDANRKETLQGILRANKILDQKGNISLANGASLDLSDPNIKLKNVSPLTGSDERGVYDIDKTNPFTNRSVSFMRPLAYYISSGLMKHDNFKSPTDLKTLDDTTGLLVNAVISGARNIEDVRKNAKDIFSKLGVTKESLSKYLNTIKNKIPESDKDRVMLGLNGLI